MSQRSEEYVLTSLGQRPSSALHVVERGGHVDATGGKRHIAAGEGALKRSVRPVAEKAAAGFTNGWITLAEWDNDPAGSPVVSFSTTWVVPPGPAHESGQFVALWNGMENGYCVLQPVLQWGNSGGLNGGGRYWSVLSWLVFADVNIPVQVSPQRVRVNPGDVLTGVITLTGQADGAFSYRCEFLGIPDSVLNVTIASVLNRCFEVLETHYMVQCTDYPAVCSAAMADIDIQVAGSPGPVHPAVAWNPSTVSDNCGEHTTVESDSASEGHVELHFRRASPLPTLAHVATSWRSGLNQTDVYLASTAGAVAMMWAGATGGWQGPLPLTQPGVMPGGGSVTGTPRAGIPGQTDVYFADNTGAVCSMSVQEASFWSVPQALTQANLVPPGARIAAGPRPGIPGETDLYFADNSGAVSTMWAVGSQPWNGPARITAPGVAPAGAPITNTPHYGIDGRTDLFFVDSNGALNVLWVVGPGNWNGPTRLTPSDVAPPGTWIAASAQYGIPGQTDVFFVDQTGSVVAFWVVADGPWNGPAALTVARVAPPGTVLAATQHQGIDNQTDLFFIDQTGTVIALWVNGNGPWNGPLALTAPVANVRGRLAAGPKYGVGGVTNVAFVDRTGQMNVMSASGTQPWTGPTVVSC
jgi:hypothetical protein